jgi:outer membrane protein TolC
VGRFFAAFNRGFQRFTQRYQDFMRRTLGRTGRMMVIYGVIVAALGVSFVRLPTSFLPDEDQGLLMAMVQLPAGASAERTRAVLGQVEDYLKTQPEVNSSISLIGMSGDQASGNLFVRLKDWSQRKGAARTPPRWPALHQGPLRHPGRTHLLHAAARGARPGQQRRLHGGAGRPGRPGPRPAGRARPVPGRSPQEPAADPGAAQRPGRHRPAADQRGRQQGRRAGPVHRDVNDTLSVALGGTYVNDFINKSRVKKVYMQGDAAYRMQPEDLNHWYVRNSAGDMVPFSAFASASWGSGPAKLERYSGMSSFEIVGSPAAGVSTGTAMAEVEKIAATLPTGITYEWAGQSFQERLSGSQAPALYALSILFVFLCLAALYESWSVPFSVMLVVPLGVIGAVLATWLAGLSNDVYFQIGLLTTVGLSAKNAILIVEFAQKLYDEGMDLMEATLQAIKLRLRPIVMTSLAFGFGVLPLAIATGAASASRAPSAPACWAAWSPPPCWAWSSSRCSTWWCAASSRAARRSIPPLRFGERGMTTRAILKPIALAAALVALLAGCVTTQPSGPGDPQWQAPVPATLGASAVAGSAALAASADPPGLADGHPGHPPAPDHRPGADQNRDLRVALRNIDAARAAVSSATADRLPTLKASAGTTTSKSADDLSSSGHGGVSRQHSASLGISAWEIDLWGRLARLDEAAQAKLLASEATARSVQATLIAEVATAWLTLAADQQSLALDEETLASQQQTLALSRSKGPGRHLGAGPGRRAGRGADGPAQRRHRPQPGGAGPQRPAPAAGHRAAGGPAAARRPNALDQTAQATALLGVPADLPSSVLLRRPDVMAAEFTLQANDANVAAARAALFPTVSLTAAAGTASTALSGLFAAGNGTWTVAPALSLPIFDWGSRQAAIDTARANQQAQLASYEKTLQTAFQEVADALAVRAQLDERLDAQTQQVQAYAQALKLTETRRALGADSALTVLEAQRSYWSARQSLISLTAGRAEQPAHLVQGWAAPEPAQVGRKLAEASSASARPGRLTLSPSWSRRCGTSSTRPA